MYKRQLYTLTMPGAVDGALYYLTPDFSKFSPELVIGALGQMFYSLSLAMGIMITYGSYLDLSLIHILFDILGYTKEQFYGEVGANLRMIVHPDDLDHLYKKSVEMIEMCIRDRSSCPPTCSSRVSALRSTSASRCRASAAPRRSRP